MNLSDLLNDNPQSPAERARSVGKHMSTVWRWMLHGVRGVRLPSHRVGGRRVILQSDWETFFAKVNGDGATEPLHSATRQREIAAAERAMDAAGIL